MTSKNNSIVKDIKQHIKDLSEEISMLDKEREGLILEKEKYEKALEIMSPKKHRRTVVYIKDTSLKDKAIYCLRKERKILGINGMLEILFEVEPTLKEDEANTKKSLRLAVFRMVKNNELVQLKMEHVKTIHYALINWADEDGNIKEKYIYD